MEFDVLGSVCNLYSCTILVLFSWFRFRRLVSSVLELLKVRMELL
jgi:hypothetical protein